MGFDPRTTVVVEDAPAGVAAGVAAGMTVLAFARHASAQELEAHGGRVFTAMTQLPDLIVTA
jgi:beta-phosphoglucomutase-like phosphatase (HAD superfamily)